jgi:hypothetical protein
MNRYKAPNIDEKDFVNNPLAGSDFKILINRVTDRERLRLVDNVYVPYELELERDEYCKVYTKSENRKIVAQLSPSAKSLFLWIVYELESGKDYLWLNKRRYMEENSVASINTYKKAIAELARLTFVCASIVKDVYWVNPRLMFSGSRINKYPSHIEDYKSKSKT